MQKNQKTIEMNLHFLFEVCQTLLAHDLYDDIVVRAFINEVYHYRLTGRRP